MLEAAADRNPLHHDAGLPLTSLGMFSRRSQDEMMRDAIRLATRAREMSRTDLSQRIRNLHKPDQGALRNTGTRPQCLTDTSNHTQKKKLAC